MSERLVGSFIFSERPKYFNKRDKFLAYYGLKLIRNSWYRRCNDRLLLLSKYFMYMGIHEQTMSKATCNYQRTTNDYITCKYLPKIRLRVKMLLYNRVRSHVGICPPSLQAV